MLATAALALALGVPCVDAVPDFALDDVSGGGAVGLVVPDAGPTTSQTRALESLRRGEVVNSLLDDAPSSPVRVGLCGRSQYRVGIPAGGRQPNDRRYAVVFPGDGILVSEATRIPGLISIADVGRGHVRVEPRADAMSYLRDLDRRIAENNRWRLPLAIGLFALVAVLAVLVPAAAVAAFSVALLANLVLGIGGASGPWTLLLIALLPVPGVLRRRQAPLAVVEIALYALAMAADATWVALSPLGPSQNCRFYGVSNLLETLFLVPAFVGAELARRRFGWIAFAAVAVLALVTVASSRLGADGGGAVVLAAGFAALVAAVVPPRRRVAAAAAVGAALAIVAAAALALGPATHVTESLAGGPAELARDLGDRVRVSYLRATANAATAALVAACVVALGVLVARGPRRPLPLAFAVAIAVSLVVNDSPREVAVGGLVGYLALARWREAAELESSSWNRERSEPTPA